MVEVQEWSRENTIPFLRVPDATDDKYSRGVVALRTGSAAYPGAAVLGVEAAWRAGAGVIRFVGCGRTADAVIARRPETIVGMDVGSTRVDAWVIGSGTDAADRSSIDESALRGILAGSAPVVVDAGALDLVAGAVAPLVLTPHAGEFARLQARLGIPAQENRIADVRRMARELGQTVLLKGARTLVASSDGAVIMVSAATPWLATAGAGDVLAGILGSLLATNRNARIEEVVAAGAWLHGHAARHAAGTSQGPHVGHPIVALDVAEALPRAISDLLA